jgi:hypothetical protein
LTIEIERLDKTDDNLKEMVISELSEMADAHEEDLK